MAQTVKVTALSLPLPLTTKMFKEAFTSLAFATLVGVFCGLAFVKIAVQANNQMLVCSGSTSKVAFANPLLGDVLYCKAK